MRVLVLNPSCEERLDVIRDVCLAEHHQVVELAPSSVAELMVSGKPIETAQLVGSLPRFSLGYDMLVVLGCPLGVLSVPPGSEEDQVPSDFVAQAEALIRAFHSAGKPLLGLLLVRQNAVIPHDVPVQVPHHDHGHHDRQEQHYE